MGLEPRGEEPRRATESNKPWYSVPILRLGLIFFTNRHGKALLARV